MMADIMGQPLGPLQFNLLTYIVSIFFGLGVPLVSILLPARSATKITPLEAMRPTDAGPKKLSSVFALSLARSVWCWV